MSPTSYRTAPPRIDGRTIAFRSQKVNPARLNSRIQSALRRLRPGGYPAGLAVPHPSRPDHRPGAHRDGAAPPGRPKLKHRGVSRSWRKAARAATVIGWALAGLAMVAGPGRADEQRVKRFGVALYAMPTNMKLDDLNDQIDELNVFTDQQNLAPINDIHWGAQFGMEGRYTINRHWTAVAGFGRIQKASTLDLLPQVGQHILVQARVLTVPTNLGAAYYFNPQTSGNFTLRPFLGGGMMRLVETKVKIGGEAVLQDTSFTNFQRPQGEGVGWYGEGGVHMMFPSRYSIILNGIYRHAKSQQVYEETTHARILNADGSPYTIDVSGFGIRFAVQISLFGKPVP